MQEEQKENKFWLKYIVIPIEVLMNKNLTAAEMKLFGLIDVLDGKDGCFASNEYMALILNLSVTAISNGISKLKNQKYVRQKSFDGRIRVIKIDPDYKKTYSQSLTLLEGRLKASFKEKNRELRIEKNTLSSLRKEDKEGNSEISCRTSNSVNSSPRSSLDTASKEVLATADSESFGKENNKTLAKADLLAKSSRPTRDDSILPRKKLPAKQLEYEHASDEARSLVEDWNELTTTPTHKKESKIVRRVLHMLDGKLLKEHTPKEIFRAMLDFSTMQKDAGNYRVPTSKVNIDDFFIGNGYLNGVRERKGETVEPPWFQRLILPGSFAKYLRREDPDPDVTEELKHRYRKHILVDQGVSFSPRQESQFREASKRLREFMGKGRLEKFLDKVDYRDYVRFLLEALIGKYKKVTEIEVGHLCSEYTWNDLFPKFIAYNWEE